MNIIHTNLKQPKIVIREAIKKKSSQTWDIVPTGWEGAC